MKMTLNEEIEYLQSGDWYYKARSVLPNDEYLKLGWAIGDILETLELLKNLAPKPETNADVIRRMSDEEMAEFLADFKDCAGNCFVGKGIRDCSGICATKGTLETWIRQPVKDDT